MCGFGFYLLPEPENFSVDASFGFYRAGDGEKAVAGETKKGTGRAV